MARTDWIYRPDGIHAATANEVVALTPSPAASFVAGTTTKILALGDSLTQGQRDEGDGGYRFKLWRRLDDAGFKFAPVGPRTSPPYTPYPRPDKWNGSGWAGYGGWTIQDLLGTGANNKTGGNTESWVATYKPDVVLLHIGTNNLGGSVVIENLRQPIVDLFTQIMTSAPNARVYVARIISYSTYYWSVTTEYNNMVKQEVDKQVALGRKFFSVDMETKIRSSSEYGDYIHLNNAGYQHMANLWYEALMIN